jgi:hypothetical protein
MGNAFHKSKSVPLGRHPKSRGTGIKYLQPARVQLSPEEEAARAAVLEQRASDKERERHRLEMIEKVVDLSKWVLTPERVNQIVEEAARECDVVISGEQVVGEAVKIIRSAAEQSYRAGEVSIKDFVLILDRRANKLAWGSYVDGALDSVLAAFEQGLDPEDRPQGEELLKPVEPTYNPTVDYRKLWKLE